VEECGCLGDVVINQKLSADMSGGTSGSSSSCDMMVDVTSNNAGCTGDTGRLGARGEAGSF
jgi:hypothetical protein